MTELTSKSQNKLKVCFEEARMAVAVHNKTSSWLEENEKFFRPPVCNKMMHNDQLKVALADQEMSCVHCTCVKLSLNSPFT